MHGPRAGEMYVTKQSAAIEWRPNLWRPFAAWSHGLHAVEMFAQAAPARDVVERLVFAAVETFVQGSSARDVMKSSAFAALVVG